MSIRPSVVIGLPDPDLGQILHAAVQVSPGEAALDEKMLKAFLQHHLARQKHPRTFDIVTEAVRDDAGKIRRSAWRARYLREDLQT
jgi:bile acid-coenzyme A ligase